MTVAANRSPDRDLASCPVKDGFRLRGSEMTRIETFTDAAFAFAVTLLVISIDMIPQSYDELILALKGVPAFGLSFLLLMMFWHAHWSWSRRYGLDDTPSVILSGSLIFVVLCYVYPLKYLFTTMLHWISGGFFPATQQTFTGQMLYATFAIYGSGFIAMCTCIALLNAHALRQSVPLRLSPLERFDTRAEILAWLIAAGVGLLSVALALFTPPHASGLPGWAYMLLPVLMPTFGVLAARRRRTRFGDCSGSVHAA